VVGVTLFTWLKYLHVFLAIVAVGFNVSYGIWITRAAKEPEHQDFTLRGVRFLDDRIANPAYVLLLLSGLGMVVVGDLDLSMFWLWSALVLWGILAVLGFGVYTPTLRRQIRVLESDGPDAPELQRLAMRGRVVGAVLGVIVAVILFLMVAKPNP
jgi:Predicted integral membrane protein (DUF2269)